MTVSIVIQYQEDHPHNPGWWRFGRPVHETREQAPEINECHRWYYGSATDALQDAREWDRQHPQG